MKYCFNCMKSYPDQEVICPDCGYDNAKRMPARMIQPGEILQGRYIVGNVKKQNASSVLYVGRDELFARRVWIIEFFPKRLCTAEHTEQGRIVTAKPECAEEFQREKEKFYRFYRELIRLYKEKDILQIFSCFYTEDTCYAIAEYHPMFTYADMLAQHGAMNANSAMEALGAAMAAVAKLDKVHGFHGGIELDSFLMTDQSDRVVLHGFETTAKADTDLYRLGMVFGALALGKEDAEREEILQWIKSADAALPSSLKKPILAMLRDGDKKYEIEGKTVREVYTDLFEETSTIELGTRKRATGLRDSRTISRKAEKKGKGKFWIWMFLSMFLIGSAVGVFAFQQMNENREEPLVEKSEKKKDSEKESKEAESRSKEQESIEAKKKELERKSEEAESAKTKTAEKTEEAQESAESTTQESPTAADGQTDPSTNSPSKAEPTTAAESTIVAPTTKPKVTTAAPTTTAAQTTSQQQTISETQTIPTQQTTEATISPATTAQGGGGETQTVVETTQQKNTTAIPAETKTELRGLPPDHVEVGS